MDALESFRQKQESDALFKLREGETPLLKFVDVGKANRQNSKEQAGLIVGLRFNADYMGFGWLHALCDSIEDYQLTCGDPHAAREMLLEGIKFTELAESTKYKSLINIGGDKK
jgi:hypothetical protein